MTSKSFTIDKREIEISSADKVLFPDEGITKAELAEYYAAVAETMLPHLAGRPISMQRFPEGITQSGFYAKETPGHFPDWIGRAEIEVLESGERQPQVIINDAATLVYLVDQGCITPHTWLSRADNLHRPDKLIFDLDPPQSFEDARAAARSLRGLLDELGLRSFVMTTGGRGLHVGVPLDGREAFDDVRAFARATAELLAEREPDRLTTKTRKKERAGRLFLDYLRNSYAQTSVPPFAVRARSGAPVATTLEWDELDDPDLHSQSYTLKNVLKRLDKKGDPWAGFHAHAQSLDEARRRLQEEEIGE